MKSTFWDRFAKSYDKNSSINEELLNLIRSYCMTDFEVLEIGTATGEMILALAPYFSEGIGIDYSEMMIKEAEKKVKPRNITFEVGDAKNLSFADESFDLIFTISTLHVISPLEDVLTSIHRVLKPKGTFIAIVPIVNHNWFKAQFEKSVMKSLKFNNYDVDEYISCFEECHFMILDHFTSIDKKSEIFIIKR